MDASCLGVGVSGQFLVAPFLRFMVLGLCLVGCSWTLPLVGGARIVNVDGLGLGSVTGL